MDLDIAKLSFPGNRAAGAYWTGSAPSTPSVC